jgi:hypothetical protein
MLELKWIDGMAQRRISVVSLFVLSLSFVEPILAGEVLRPLRTDRPPVIDGKLDDSVWQLCPSVTDFKTFAPDFGRDGTQKTTAYMAYDSENLYFAFHCFDSEPNKIKSAVSARDNVSTDDWVCINLDSFNDQQSLYALYVNPAGIQMDSRYAAGKEDFSADVVWYSAGQMDGDGYTIEMSIPLRSIRYSETNPVTMSVFFERYISRLSEHSSYPALKPEMGLNFLPQMTPLLYPDVKHFTLFELLPAITYSQKHKLDAGNLVLDERKSDFSLTTKYGITSDLILDATYNPDFSQVEADAGQVDVNLRYALYYPEKRPFFLEGNEIYNVAATQSSDIDPIVSIVHTRTIVSPLLGTKLSGKVDGKNTVALLYAMDRISPDETGLFGDYAHFPIMRYKHSMADDSYLGAIYAGREVKGRYNRVGGIDGMIRATQASLLEFNALYSSTKPDSATAQKPGHSIGLKYGYGTRDLEYYVSLHDIDEDFAVESGYITRTGISAIATFLRPKFYPQSSIVQRITVDFFTGQTYDKFSQLWETYNYLALRPFFLGSMNASLIYIYSNEIFLGQRFKTNGFQAAMSGLLSKQIRISASYRTGNAIYYSSAPYQGSSNLASATIIYQPTENIESNSSLVYSDFHRASDGVKIYDYPIIRERLTYQMNRYLFFRGIAEYNKYRRSLLTDLLASFTYIPGTVAYVGYGALYERIQWDSPSNSYLNNDQFLESQRGFFLKVSYLWRI